ncbi:bifunctional diaminohydroxyphosphoribosylaminopyrimidine deaminase/5-amino-6-(5-phosphoribosylamino)uracil reductase RibD [Candidatus Nitronereus thalassa]|uniref:Riboflavin biosynthesis protein RibD n=2 Tax=Candidatus Nitronereus thalassa TaxID=3020898 RepID=A0ABU3KC39_9BACT|nr:bifunctional diaminohydroxyphosphoribosylaminopyrimidine deaminase/5-amino-6-(5-phosphoribosylamino)uracil reductase RibD [Candidatus Nitronereus thalassa]MDT7043794.1 bifunctional diaminohydroxyphosphoribosylaminopyrimidine deaminase/5-amino-6-(5-phosphoribosylamino)uracil reductase RibD [Candidatus Nitronereus thalassa]
MKQALTLAARGRGTTSPNPMVGAVVVAKGKRVGSGYHKQAGGPHAEVFALEQAKSKSRHATLYLTLEPCCHTEKRTPPCVPLIIQSGVRRVVVAMRDPNPQVAGRGLQQLKRAGIRVDVGCLKREAAELNEVYIHWVKTGQPFVILKAAMTLDGQIATATGESKWITGMQARAHVHQLRSQVDAIAVGVNTVFQDDPQLTARLSGQKEKTSSTRQPVRLIFDSTLRIPLDARVLKNIETSPTAIATTSQASHKKMEQLRSKWVEVLVVPQKAKRVSIRRCLQELGNMGITSLMVEGGSELNASFLREGLVNRVFLYMAPTLLGGQNSKGLVGGLSPKHLVQKIAVSNIRMQPLGDDVLISGDLNSKIQ